MSHSDLLQALDKTMKKVKVRLLADQVAQQQQVQELLELTFFGRSDIAFRAAWVLENVAEGHYERFIPVKQAFFQAFPQQKNQSCRRHYLKILLEIQSNHDLRSGVGTEPLIEAVFEWLIDEKAPVAVKVHCFALLLRFSEDEPWIAEELAAQTEFMMKTGSAGLVSRGKKVLKELATGR